MTKKNILTFKGRLALQQRVLPSYRAPFFQALANKCEGRLSLFAGHPRPVEAINTISSIENVDIYPAINQHYFSKQFYICNQTNIIEWLEATNPVTLIVEANARYPSTHKAVDWMHARSRKVLSWGLGVPPLKGFFSGIRSSKRNNLLTKLDGLISYSERGAEEYIKMGIASEKVFIAHNAAAHRPTSAPPSKDIKKTGPLNILFVGRLQARKKLDSLFRACAKLEEKPNIIIAGDGPDRHFFELAAAKAYPNAVFVGAKYGKELKPYYAEADLFVLPGTGGLAVQEAMANGLPVIVAQGDGTQDDLVRPENGWLIPPDDQAALLSTLKDALSNLPRLRKMGDESFRITLEEINIDTMSDKFIHAINTITETGK